MPTISSCNIKLLHATFSYFYVYLAFLGETQCMLIYIYVWTGLIDKIWLQWIICSAILARIADDLNPLTIKVV